ncbi:hypothetical protein FFF34_000730 [Inquilinus sp. KBS0705]|nr:hypothetical protein FFF34_000730 [Inquilinus sp. KBS0705]
MNKKLTQAIIYLLCLYDVYLYLPDAFDVFKLNVNLPTLDALIYFDALLLVVGGIIIGIALLKQGGSFNKYLGMAMIVANVVLRICLY